MPTSLSCPRDSGFGSSYHIPLTDGLLAAAAIILIIAGTIKYESVAQGLPVL